MCIRGTWPTRHRAVDALPSLPEGSSNPCPSLRSTSKNVPSRLGGTSDPFLSPGGTSKRSTRRSMPLSQPRDPHPPTTCKMLLHTTEAAPKRGVGKAGKRVHVQDNSGAERTEEEGREEKERGEEEEEEGEDSEEGGGGVVLAEARVQWNTSVHGPLSSAVYPPATNSCVRPSAPSCGTAQA